MAELQLSRQSMRTSLAAETLRASGHLRLRVYGTSMLGAIWPGDVLHCERCDVESVRVGDILLYVRGEQLIAHRVVELHGAAGHTRVVTRGDRLRCDDPFVDVENILGRVGSVHRDGLAPRHISRRSRTQQMISAGLARSELMCELALRVYALYVRLARALALASRSRNAPAFEVQG